MKVFHIDQFKCTLCSNWFCPPFNLPYLLKCSHSICTNCLQSSVQNHTLQIICPQDMSHNIISDIQINQSTKKALQRLLKQHKNFTKTNDLQCIKILSLSFDQLLDSKQIQLKNLSTLIDQIFQNQIKRLTEIYQKIKTQINRPFRIVNDWKQVVRNYLKKVKSSSISTNTINVANNTKLVINQLNHYIEQGRKIKLDLNQYLKFDFSKLVDYLLIQPHVCFLNIFTIFQDVQLIGLKQKQEQFNINMKPINNKIKLLAKQQKVFTLSKPNVNSNNNNIDKSYYQHQHPSNKSNKQIHLKDITNNFDQSSIHFKKSLLYMNNNNNYEQSNSKINNYSNIKPSLYEELLDQSQKYQKGRHFNNNANCNANTMNNKNTNNTTHNNNNNENIHNSKSRSNVINHNNHHQNNNKKLKQSVIYPFEQQQNQYQHQHQNNAYQLQLKQFYSNMNQIVQNCQDNNNENDYNSIIKSKINKLKQSHQFANSNNNNNNNNNKNINSHQNSYQNSQQKTNNYNSNPMNNNFNNMNNMNINKNNSNILSHQKSKQQLSKMGQSLQYSPQMNQTQYDQYSILDSYDFIQNTNSIVKLIQNHNNNFNNNNNNSNSFNHNHNNYNNNNGSPLRSQKYHYQQGPSLQSYYQQSTTLNCNKNNKNINNNNNNNNHNNSIKTLLPTPTPSLLKKSFLIQPTPIQSSPQQLQQSPKSPQSQPKQQQQQQNLLYSSQRKNHIKNIPLPQKNDWHMQNINFLKEWKIKKNQKQQQPLQIIQKYGGYNCQKQKDRYIKKIQQNRAKQLYEQTNINDNYIQLVGHSLQDCNIHLFLSQFPWSTSNIQIIKLIRTSLSDIQMNHLLNFLVHSSVHTLMLSSNNLTEISLDALLNFVEINRKLKNIYVPKNNISLLKGNARAKINLLKEKGINIYI